MGKYPFPKKRIRENSGEKKKKGANLPTPGGRKEQKVKKSRLLMKRLGLVKKSEQTGVPYGILKKSYDRGMVHIKVDIEEVQHNNNGHLQE